MQLEFEFVMMMVVLLVIVVIQLGVNELKKTRSCIS